MVFRNSGRVRVKIWQSKLVGTVAAKVEWTQIHLLPLPFPPSDVKVAIDRGSGTVLYVLKRKGRPTLQQRVWELLRLGDNMKISNRDLPYFDNWRQTILDMNSFVINWLSSAYVRGCAVTTEECTKKGCFLTEAVFHNFCPSWHLKFTNI